MFELFDKKDVFSWSNCEDAKEYIGKEGYFNNTCNDLTFWDKGILIEVNENLGDCTFDAKNTPLTAYSLFIPLDKVKKPEKKWRAFETIEEFVKIIGDVGTIVTYRIKEESSQERKGMFIGYIWDSYSRGWIIGLGVNLYRLEKLFKSAEYKHKNSWQPFGVLKEVEE